MQQNFYQYLQPTLWLINVFGITYNISASKYLQNITSFLLAMPNFAIHFFFLIYVAFAGIPSTNSNYYLMTNVMKVSNKIGFIMGPLFGYSKGIYYFVRRKAVKDLLLQVSLNASPCYFYYCDFQISNLDEITLIKQPIRKNKYRNLSILLFALISFIAWSWNVFSPHQNLTTYSFVYHYEYFNYGTSVLTNAMETLLVHEITTQLSQKFCKLNANIHERKIVALMEIHNKLSATSRKINNVFGFPAVIIAAVDFYVTTTTLYFTLQLSSLPPTTTSILQLLASTIWSVACLTEVLILVKCFENVSEKVS